MITLPPILTFHLLQFKHQQYLHNFLHSTLICLSILLCGLIGIATTDALFHWPLALRNIMSVCLWAYCLWIVCRDTIRPLFKKTSLQETAAAYEKLLPAYMKDSLTSSVSFAEDTHTQVSAWMMERSIATSAQLLRDLPSVETFRFRRIVFWLIVVISTTFALLLTPITSTYIQRACAPWSNIPRHSDIQFLVQPEQLGVSRGSNILITVRSQPAQKQLQAVILWADGHSESRICKPDTNPGTFYLDLGPIIQTCSVHFKSGESESKRYAVDVHATPQVTQVHLDIHPPQYSAQQQPQRVSGGDAQVIQGSHIQFHADISETTIQRARLIAENKWQQELNITATDNSYRAYHISGSWQGEHSLHYQLELYDEYGIRTVYPQEWSLTVQPDQKPHTQISHLYGPLLDAQQLLEVRLQADDDTGLESITYTLRCNDIIITSAHVPFTSAITELDMQLRIPLRMYELNIGDHLELSTTTTDLSGQSITTPAIRWSIVSGDKSLWAPIHDAFKKISRRLRYSRTMTHELRRRWRDLDDNFRLDEEMAQRAALLIHDQQSRHIINELRTLEESCRTLASRIYFHKHSFQTHIPKRLSIIRKQLHFARQLAESNLSNRGSYILSHDDQNAIPALIRQSIDDSDDFDTLLEHIESNSDLLRAQLRFQNIINFINAQKNRYAQLKSSLLAHLAWSKTVYQKGLHCNVYANRDLSGKPTSQQQRPVSIDNSTIEGIGTENFSIHWYGDVYISQPGSWIIKVTADDGIRCSIDEQELFPSAWKNQSTQTYSAKKELSIGWHRLHIRYYQDLSNSNLRMWMGQTEKTLITIDRMQLRSSRKHAQEQNIQTTMRVLASTNIKQRYQALIEVMYTLYNFQNELNNPMPDSRIQRLLNHSIDMCEKQTAYISSIENKDPQMDTVDEMHEGFNELQKNLQKILTIMDKKWRRQEATPFVGLRFDTFIDYAQHVLQSVSIYENWEASYEAFIRAHRLAERQHPQLWHFFNVCIQELRSIVNNKQYSVSARQKSLRFVYEIQKIGAPALRDINLHEKSSIWKIKNLVNNLHKIQKQLLSIRWDQAKESTRTLLSLLQDPQEKDLPTQQFFKNIHIDEMIRALADYAEHIGLRGVLVSDASKKDTDTHKKYTQMLTSFFKSINSTEPYFKSIERLQKIHLDPKSYTPQLSTDIIRGSLLNAEYAATTGRMDIAHKNFFLSLHLKELGTEPASKKWINKTQKESAQLILKNGDFSRAYTDAQTHYTSDSLLWFKKFYHARTQDNIEQYRLCISSIHSTGTSDISLHSTHATSHVFSASTQYTQQLLDTISTSNIILQNSANDIQQNFDYLTQDLRHAQDTINTLITDSQQTLKTSTFAWKKIYAPLLKNIQKLKDNWHTLSTAEHIDYMSIYMQARTQINDKTLKPLARIFRTRIQHHKDIDQDIYRLTKRLSHINKNISESYSRLINSSTHGMTALLENIVFLQKNYQHFFHDAQQFQQPTNDIDIKQLMSDIKRHTQSLRTHHKAHTQLAIYQKAIESIHALSALLDVLDSEQQLQALQCLVSQQQLIFEYAHKRNLSELTLPHQDAYISTPFITSLKQCARLVQQLNNALHTQLLSLADKKAYTITRADIPADHYLRILEHSRATFLNIEETSLTAEDLLQRSAQLFTETLHQLFAHAMRHNTMLDNDALKNTPQQVHPQEQYTSTSQKLRNDMEERFRSQRKNTQLLIQQQGYYINKQYFNEEQQHIIDDYFTRLAEDK